MTTRTGYRGYIGSRSYFGNRVPQHVQNLVIRDYCRQRGYEYLLSVTEYAMPGCHMILERALEELPSISGIVLYSLFMLPEDRARRLAVYRRVLDVGGELHAAVESHSLGRNGANIGALEDIWMVQQWLPAALPARQL